jgi:tRNA nucleotidyltransferase (CCA-adding enzyme)
MEFNKLIMGSNYQSILLNYRQIIEVFLPEIKDLTNQELEYRLYSMKALNSLTLRLALLLHGMEPTDKILMNLKYDNKTVKTVKLLTENINEKIHPDPVTIKKWLNKLDYENLASLIKIKKALFDKEYEKLTKSQAIMEEILASNQCYSLKTLAVNGQDLLDAGIPKGRRIGMVLNKVLGEVIEGKLVNKKDVLLNYIYGLQKTVDKDDD